MNSRISPESTTITNAVGCNLPAYLGTGTVESVTPTRLVISGGDFLQQMAGSVPYKFQGTTYLIVGAAGPVMTTEIIRVKSVTTVYGDYAAIPVVPDSALTINLVRPTGAPLPAGTPFYFCDPSMLDGFISSMMKNMTATSATYTDPSGGVGTIIGLDYFTDDTTPSSGSVIVPVMVDATGTEVEITNQRA